MPYTGIAAAVAAATKQQVCEKARGGRVSREKLKALSLLGLGGI